MRTLSARSSPTCSASARSTRPRVARLFRASPAGLAAHPADEDGRHELYLMCDDMCATVPDLERKGGEFTRPVSDERWRPADVKLPGGGQLGLYEPRHASPIDL